ncbi:NUDIX domain-containing protein [Candidatus Wolfebacteria bacterium]|nr:NUDIX domain-containing protein [Candidatus Wolfebacteria bacterium]
MGSNWIDPIIYNQITKLLPIPCVDLVIVYKGKFLLGKRINEPAKGLWFILGGRILKNETLENAAIRKAKEEVGIKIGKKDMKFLATKETMFRGKKSGDRHTINSIFVVRLRKFNEIDLAKADKNQNSEFGWFSKADKKWHFYVKDVLKLAGFR